MKGEPPAEETRTRGAQTLMNGLEVLAVVGTGVRTIAAIQRTLGLSRSTTHRLVQALREAHYLRETDEGLKLGSKLIELGFRAVNENPLLDVARPVLRHLSDQVQDTVHLAVEDENAVLYLEKLRGQRGTEMRSSVGTRMPLTRTGIGKALLLDAEPRWMPLFAQDAPRAALPGPPPPRAPRTPEEFAKAMAGYREVGYTFDFEENEVGVRCVAAPVRAADGAIVAAISVAASTPYMPDERMRELAGVVVAHADELSLQLGAPRTRTR